MCLLKQMIALFKMFMKKTTTKKTRKRTRTRKTRTRKRTKKRKRKRTRKRTRKKRKSVSGASGVLSDANDRVVTTYCVICRGAIVSNGLGANCVKSFCFSHANQVAP